MMKVKNKPYPLYNIPSISNIWNMISIKAEKQGNKVAYRYRKGRKEIVQKTFFDVYYEVSGLRSYINKTYGTKKHIAIIGENSYEWIQVFYSIVCSGNVAIPIDKELPTKEVCELLKFADVEIVFCSSAYLDLVVNEHDINVISMKSVEHLIEEGKKCNVSIPEKLFASDKLACIFFTSGTSGESKGVMLSHGNITSEINDACRLFKLEGDTLSVLPFHHALGLVVAVLMVFNYGYANFINKSLKTIMDDMQLAKPQTMILVPLFVETFYRQIMQTAKNEKKNKTLKNAMKLSNALLAVGIDKRKKLFASLLERFGGNLTYIICGGAFLDSLYVKKFRAMGIEILNGYGTTECSPCVAVNRNYYSLDGSVGQIIPNVAVKISEENEVLLSGPVVMQGYYKRPEITAEVLKDGWYATGDIGYYDKNGFLTLTGRKKNLIILSNGENISPEGIEADFQRDLAVSEVLVYEKNAKIVAEIYPIDEYMGQQDYFNALMDKVNLGRPIYKQVAAVILRDHEFIKNTSKKIVRYKNILEGNE